MTPKEKRTFIEISKHLGRQCFILEGQMIALSGIVAERCASSASGRAALRSDIQKRLQRAGKRHLAQKKDWFRYVEALIKHE